MTYPDDTSKDFTHISNAISLMRGGADQGIEPENLLKSLALAPALLADAEGQFPRRKVGELLRAIASRLQDETLGFLSRKTRPGGTALAVHATLTSENLSEAILRWQSFWMTVQEDMDLSLEIRGEEAHLIGRSPWNEAKTLENYAFLIWISFLQLRIFMWLIGKPILLDRLCFEFSRPQSAEEFTEMFPTRIYFERDANTMVMSRKYLDMPIVQKPTSAAAFIDILFDLMTTQWADRSVSGRVSLLLKGSDHLDLMTFASAAHGLQMAPDVLRRRLKKEGYTFKLIKEGVRRDLAIYHLQASELRINEIGYRLGFSEPATFNRAFKQWTGRTPGEFRKESSATKASK